MKLSSVLQNALALVAVFRLCASAHAQATTDYCADIAVQMMNDPTNPDQVGNFVKGISDISCFIQANLTDPAAKKTLNPARASIWNALQSVNGAQQQGSSVSSSASTNAVSKPSGPTSLIEEFGGINTTSGTSSFTVQWAPGTMLTNLAYNGVVSICAGKISQPGCIRPGLIKTLNQFSLKVTANTSGPSPAVNGTSSGSGTASTQPITASSATASKPGFSGLTVQYSIYGSKGKAAATALANDANAQSDASQGSVSATVSKVKNSNSPSSKSTKSAPAAATSNAVLKTTAAIQSPAADVKAYLAELSTANEAENKFGDCSVFLSWQMSAKSTLTTQLGKEATTQADIEAAINLAYRDLFQRMQTAPDCKSAVAIVPQLYATILEAAAYDDFGSSSTTSSKPEFALEYDLNTPQTSPSTSSVKFNGSWQFGGKSAGKATPPTLVANNSANGTTASTTGKPTAETHMQALALSEATKLFATKNPVAKQAAASSASQSPSASGQTTKSTSQQAGQSTPPWTITATGTVDLYNQEPPSSVPSGSHLKDYQAGAEISYLFSPGDNANSFRKLIGNVTASGAYSYQYQNSPSLLTGPALTDFTGLPSSATTAYAQRGPINLGQAKLGFGTGTNMTFPLVFTYSNRSELVVHPTWGLQFGVSYNLTSLLNSLGGGSKSN